MSAPSGRYAFMYPSISNPSILIQRCPCSNPTSTVASMRRYGVLFRKLRTAECIAQKYGPAAPEISAKCNRPILPLGLDSRNGENPIDLDSAVHASP